MFDQVLKFYARGDASMPCPHGADASPQRRAVVGKKHVEVSTGQWAWVPDDYGKPYVAKYHHDLVKACKEGDLWPADQATADICGVKFDPTLGGTVDPKTAKAPAGAAPTTPATSAKAAAKDA